MGRHIAALSMICILGACAPEGPSAYIDFNLVPDQDCHYDPSGTVEFYGVGYFDISDSGRPGKGTGNCAHSYFLHLRVNSGLRSNKDQQLGRAEPNVLQVTQVEVTLMDGATGAVIDFNRGGVSLENPFLLTTTISLEPSDGTQPGRNVAAIEAIPVAYAGLLNNFVGGQVMAEIQMYGTTLGDVNVDFKPFRYPIQICKGCLSMCVQADITDKNMNLDDVKPSGVCSDNAGYDGRVCYDPDC